MNKPFSSPMVIIVSFCKLVVVGIIALAVFCVVVVMSIVKPVLLLVTSMVLLAVLCIMYAGEQVWNSLKSWWNYAPVVQTELKRKQRRRRNKGFDFGIKRR